MAEAISISESFKATSKRLHDQMESGGGMTPEGVSEAVALELGVPLEQLIEAVAQESMLGLMFMALRGPRPAICASSISAFLAGVAWEQGRRG